MSSGHIPVSLPRRARLRANERCEYCRMAQLSQEATFHLDHVVPQAVGGVTSLENLALACVSCSLRKEHVPPPSIRPPAMRLKKDDMQGSERDPETIVQRLLQSERHLSTGARDEVLAPGAAAVPALLRILNDEALEGWAPVHAVRLLGRMRISEAIGPMLRALAETDSLDMLRDAIVASMPEIGAPVVEPALRAYTESDDLAFRESVSSILSRIGVRDDRIFTVLLEMLAISPSRVGDLAQYGDDRALPYLARAFDAYTLRASDSPLARRRGPSMSRPRPGNSPTARPIAKQPRFLTSLGPTDNKSPLAP